MKKIINLAVIGGASIALAACGSSEDASTEATADTVEMPANEPLEPVSEEPVEDEAGTSEPVEADAGTGPAPVTQEAAETAADDAVDVVDRAQAAADEAEAAAAAAAGAMDEEQE